VVGFMCDPPRETKRRLFRLAEFRPVSIQSCNRVFR
jgi:hypothetical protein